MEGRVSIIECGNESPRTPGDGIAVDSNLFTLSVAMAPAPELVHAPVLALVLALAIALPDARARAPALALPLWLALVLALALALPISPAIEDAPATAPDPDLPCTRSDEALHTVRIAVVVAEIAPFIPAGIAGAWFFLLCLPSSAFPPPEGFGT